MPCSLSSKVVLAIMFDLSGLSFENFEKESRLIVHELLKEYADDDTFESLFSLCTSTSAAIYYVKFDSLTIYRTCDSGVNATGQ